MEQSSYGMWWDPSEPDHKVAGRLTWEPLRAPRLSLLDPPPSMWAHRRSEGARAVYEPGAHVPMLHGLLADHGLVTLLRCRWDGLQFNATSTQRLAVGRAVVGAHLDYPDEAILRAVEVEWPALEALLGPYPVRPARPLSSRSKRVSLVVEHRTHRWDDNGVSVSWGYRPNAVVDTRAATVTMQPIATLMSSTPRSLTYWIDEWLVPMNELITIATGAKANPASVGVWMARRGTGVERMATLMTVLLQGVGHHDYEAEPARVVLDAQAIAAGSEGLPTVIRRTRELAVAHEVFLDLISGVINYGDRPLRNRYLDLTAALEAYHSQRSGPGPLDAAEFKARRTAALSAVAKSGVAREDLRFLKRWLASRPAYSLEQRIESLARLVEIRERWSIEPRAMAALRNDVAHGNTGLDHAALGAAYQQAFDLCRLLVLHELGLGRPAGP